MDIWIAIYGLRWGKRLSNMALSGVVRLVIFKISSSGPTKGSSLGSTLYPYVLDMIIDAAYLDKKSYNQNVNESAYSRSQMTDEVVWGLRQVLQ